MHCPNCGKELNDNQKFCGGCGNDVSAVWQKAVQEAVPVAPAPAPAPAVNDSAFGPIGTPMPAPVAPAAQTAPEKPKKKKGGKIGLIIGLSAAGLAVLVGLIIGVSFIFKSITVEETTHSKKTTATETTEETEITPATARRTVMVYAIGTDLESNGSCLSADVKEMLAAQPGSDVNIVLQTGGCKNFQNTFMEDGACQRFVIQNGNIKELENLGDVSMVEQDTLRDFVKFAKENFPAESYILVLWDHGGGVPLGFGSDELHDGKLTEIEMADAIRQADIEFESVIFNACLMGSLEVAKALAPYTEYVVAAESPTWGSAYYDIGINYTNFFNFIGADFNGSTKDYCEFIVRDYMDTIEATQDATGNYSIDTCMSAIDTDNIDEVLAAYEKFIAALDSRVFQSNGYAEYIQLREACGSFKSTDSVDLTTLASKYINCGDKNIEGAASKLVNEVSNCVFTESNNSYTYAHGMTTYSPYQYPQLYDEARLTFTTLGYSDTTISFYDKFVSKELYVLKMTDKAGSWYVKPTDAGSIQSGNVYDLSKMVVNMGNYEAIKLSADDWKNIREVKVTLAYIFPDDKSKIYYLGSDNQYAVDSNNYIILQNPTNWVYFNNFGFVTCECLKYEVTEDGKWKKFLGAEALINGETAYIVIASSSDNPAGEIIGYYYADILKDSFDANQGRQFTDTDKIAFVREYYDAASKKMSYETLGKGQTVTINDAKSLYKYSSVDYSNVVGYIGFDIYDVYNNDYKLQLREGKPASEINASTGSGSSSSNDNDGTDATSMVGSVIIYDSSSILKSSSSQWFSANGNSTGAGTYNTNTSSITLKYKLTDFTDEEFQYAYYYSEDNMFSKTEIATKVSSGKAKATQQGSEYILDFDYTGTIKPGYYVIVIYNSNGGKVAISGCKVG